MPNIRSSRISASELQSIVELVNPDTDKFTCTGCATTKGRRCRLPIAKENRFIAEDIVRELPRISQNRSELWIELYELAERTLCRNFHQNQASEVALDWYKAIVRKINTRNPSSSVHRRDTSRTTSVVTSTTATSPPLPVPSRRVSATRAQHSSLQSTEQHNHDPNNAKSHSTSTDDDDTCPICYKAFKDPCRTPCGHKFCRECISDWLELHETCPYDRKSLRAAELITIETSTSEDSSCTICRDSFAEPRRTPCGHTFCRECITTWLKSNPRKTCPLDRKPLRQDDLVSITTS